MAVGAKCRTHSHDRAYRHSTTFRVGEEVTPLTPHRPERAQLRHSVPHRTASLTYGHSDGRSSVWVGEKPVVLDQMLPSTGNSSAAIDAIATCAISGEPRDAGYSNCSSSHFKPTQGGCWRRLAHEDWQTWAMKIGGNSGCS